MRAFLTCLFFPVLLTAQTVYYPGVASAPGANDTQWRTQVTLYNPSDTIKSAILSLQPFGSAGASYPKEYRLGTSETLGIDDLYADLGAGSGAGVLRVEGPVLAWVRTYNQGEGTFGQNIPPVDPTAGYAAGQRVYFPLRMPASAATDFRSNLLLFNLSDATVHFTLKSGTATAPAELPARAATLIINVGAPLGLPPGPAPLTVTADGRWTGFISTVDPALGDPTTVLGLTAPADDGLRFPGVASAPGANQTRWRSELELYNPGTGTATAQLTLTPLGTAQPGGSVRYPIGGGELLLIEDVYALFGQEPGAGVLLVEGAVLAWVRTFNQGDEGTFGQNIPPLPVGTAFPAGQARLFPLQTAHNIGTDFRSNLMLLNPGGADVHFQLDAGDAPAYPVTLPAGMALLFDALGDTMGLNPGLAALAVSADGPWSGFISTVDPALGDPTTVEGLPTPCTPPSVNATGPESACQNDTIAFAAAYPSEAAVTWIVAGGSILSGQGTATITVAATHTGSCTATAVITLDACTASDSVTTLVHALPVATVSGTATICAGQSATLRATLTGSRPFDITWSDGVVQNGVASPAARLATPAVTTTYTVTAVTDRYCIGTGSGSAVITVDTVPVLAGFSASPGTIPFGGMATISFSVSGAAGWTLSSAFGNAISPAEGTTNGVLQATYDATTGNGSDTITLTATNHCDSVQATTTIVVTP